MLLAFSKLTKLPLVISLPAIAFDSNDKLSPREYVSGAIALDLENECLLNIVHVRSARIKVTFFERYVI